MERMLVNGAHFSRPPASRYVPIAPDIVAPAHGVTLRLGFLGDVLLRSGSIARFAIPGRLTPGL